MVIGSTFDLDLGRNSQEQLAAHCLKDLDGNWHNFSMVLCSLKDANLFFFPL